MVGKLMVCSHCDEGYEGVGVGFGTHWPEGKKVRFAFLPFKPSIFEYFLCIVFSCNVLSLRSLS